MFCPNCGKKVKEGNFCEECGYKFKPEDKPSKPKKPVKKIKKLTKRKIKFDQTQKGKIIIGVLALILIVSIGTFYHMGSKYSTAQKVGDKYIEYLQNREWGNLYGLLDIKENEFINKKSFIKAANQMDMSDLDTLDYLDNSIFPGTINWSKVLRKIDKKRYFFFDEWKVPEDFTNEIKVPYLSGCAVELDGIDVDEKYLTEENEEIFYKIPMYLSENTIKYNDKKGLLKETEYKISNDSTDINLAFSDKAKDEAEKKLEASLNDLTKYVMNKNTTVSDIQQYFVSEEAAESFYQGFVKTEDNIVKPAEIQGNISIMGDNDSHEANMPAVSFIVSCEYKSKVNNSFWGISDDTRSFDEDTIVMEYVNGKWLIGSNGSIY